MINVTIKEFLKLSDSEKAKYILLLNTLNPKEVIPFDLNSKTWDDIKAISNKINLVNDFNKAFEVFKLAFNIEEDFFYSISIVNFFYLKKFLIEKIVYLRKNEVSLLSGVNEHAALWEMAGGKKLDAFSDNIPLSQLAKIYGGYPFDYGKKPYIEILMLLKMNKEQNEIESKFNDLRSKTK